MVEINLTPRFWPTSMVAPECPQCGGPMVGLDLVDESSGEICVGASGWACGAEDCNGWISLPGSAPVP